MEVINPTAEDLVRGRILQDVAVSSSKKMATRKLNSSGIMTGHCAVINSEESMSRYRDELQRMATIESFKSSEEKRAQSKKKEKEDAMRSIVLLKRQRRSCLWRGAWNRGSLPVQSQRKTLPPFSGRLTI